MKLFSKRQRVIAIHILVGACIGIILLHPITKIVYWFEFRKNLGAEGESLWPFLMSRFESAFLVEMIPMSLVFAVTGGSIGMVFAFYPYSTEFPVTTPC